MSTLLKTSNASVYIQPDGPNTEPLYGGCYDVTGFDIPDVTTTPIRCINDNGDGWDVIGERVDPPGNATASLAAVQTDVADYLDKLGNCGASLYINMACGKRGVWGSYGRSWILPNFRRAGRSFAPLAARETITELIGTYNLQASGAILIQNITVGAKATTETQTLNDVWANTFYRCADDCGKKIGLGQYVIAVANAAGAATANVLLSTDYGQTWTAAAADPFAVGEHIKACTMFQVRNNTTRLLVAKEGTGGAVQGQVSYSDDWGATWTDVSVGGAAAGHGPKYGGGLFALDESHIWIAGEGGYIYFSDDGGLTWTAQEAGVITAGGDFYQVHFADKNYGMAVGVSGITAVTSDGGATWAAGGVIGGAMVNLMCVHVVDKWRAWVGDESDDTLYYTEDGGDTWTTRTTMGGAKINDIQFINDHVGFTSYTDAATKAHLLRTINGGFTWELVDTPANGGVYALNAVDENTCFMVGEGAVTAFIAKAAAI